MRIAFLIFVCSLTGISFSGAQVTHEAAWDLYKRSTAGDHHFQKKTDLARQSLIMAKQLSDDSLICLAHIQLGILHWKNGEFDSSRTYLNTAESYARKKFNHLIIGQSLHYKGLGFYYQCSFDTALRYYEQAETQYGLIKNDSAIAKIKSHKGLIYSVLGRYEDLTKNITDSFRLQENMPGYRDLSVPIQFPSEASKKMYYETKLQKDFESLKFVSSRQNNYKIAFTLHNIAYDLYYLKRYKEAIPYLKKGSSMYQKLDQPAFLDWVGITYSALGMYDSAHYYFNKRLLEIDEGGTRLHRAALYTNIAVTFQKEKKWQEALRYYQLAMELNVRMNLLRSSAGNRRSIAEVLIQTGNLHAALSEIENALKIVKAIGCKKDQEEFLYAKATLLDKLGMSQAAFKAMQESKEIRNSIMEGENQVAVVRLQIEYESEKKNRDLEKLTAQNQLKEAEIKNKNLILILAVVVVALILTFFLFGYQRYRHTSRMAGLLGVHNELMSKQNDMLRQQGEQKEVLLHEIHHRVKNNLQIMASLINLKSRGSSPETSEALQQLNGRVFSMGLLHEKLFAGDMRHSIRLDEYLLELAGHILNSLGNQIHTVRLVADCAPAIVESEIALTCGLIENELLTNSLKYAFEDDQPDREIKISLRCIENKLEMIWKDNGRKLSSKPESIRESFGMRFIDQLVTTKLHGSWEFRIDQGFIVTLLFPCDVLLPDDANNRALIEV